DEKLQILLDGEVMNEVSQEEAKNPPNQWSPVVYPFRERHSIILNLAIGGPGGDPTGAKFPMVFEVDYVRVYRRISGK
ncbi:MAG: glycoside hydrolase family 16 protein, partial [Armatimonadota bacterium]|nr:glycoside hydrolase family 16 protein [Armatimonadota bacterium]MDW8144644.1 glycoside hydrolase family 16 protein [Armatimonadota bacterium]